MYMLTDLLKTPLRNDYVETFPRYVRSSTRNECHTAQTLYMLISVINQLDAQNFVLQ